MAGSFRSRRYRSAVVGIAVIFAVAGAARVSSACDLYVRAARAGQDAGDGTSPDRAFATITAASLAIDNPGTIVCVGPGTYAEGNIGPGLNGSEVSPIEYRADPSGVSTGDSPGPVVIRGDGLQGAGIGAAFLLMGRKNIIIDGFTISGFGDAGIQVRSGGTEDEGNSAGIVIRNNSIRDCGSGIDVSAEQDIVVESNDVVDNASTGIGITACRGPALGGIKCRAGESATVVPRLANNRVIYNLSHGIFLQEANGGYVQNTVAFGNLTGVTARATSDLQIVNNLIYGNASDAVVIGSAGQRSTGTLLMNNTLYGNGGWAVRVGDESSSSADTRVLNNLSDENDSGSIAVSRPSTCGYVAGFNLVGDAGGYGLDTPINRTYDRQQDPGFVNPSGPDGILGWQVRNGALVDFSGDDDFHLRPDSAGIDAGYSTAATLGLDGVARSDEAFDDGATDLGYHYGAGVTQQIKNVPADPFMPIYVRTSGAPGQDGRTPATALSSLNEAAGLAKAGVTVIVGPGAYAAANVGPADYSGKVAFRADAMGTLTGDPAGAVLVDPSLLPVGSNKDTGFFLRRNCGSSIDGFAVRFASDSGIQVREGADKAVVKNNTVFTNTRGISIIDANDVSIVNNLVYDNDTGGIEVGGKSISARARIQNNTVYKNARGNGLTIGVGTATAPDAQVDFNIISENGLNGINARESYRGRYNLYSGNGAGNFGGIAARQDGDRVDEDPLFVNPAGEDGHLGGKRYADDRFLLRQVSVGDPVTSPAVDAGPITARKAGVDTGTTRSDGENDIGAVDLGFHSPARPADVLYVDPNGSDTNSGRLTNLPLKTIAEALRRAASGTAVQVRAGTYEESNLRPAAGVRLIGAGPASSTVLASSGQIGVDIRLAGTSVEGLTITGATDAGVRIRADDAEVINCWVSMNGRGVVIGEGLNALVFNNLIVRNAGTGVVVGSAAVAAEAATVVHNTIYGNAGFGVSVGYDASAPSIGAVVAGNIIDGNSLKGMGSGGESATTLRAGRNCNRDGYRGMAMPPSDLAVDPLFLAPTAQPEPDLRLEQVAAGDSKTSPCVDGSFRTAAQIGLDEATTRRDGAPDSGLADIGYHYGPVRFDPSMRPLLRFGAPIADCDQDGTTRVNDVVVGVNVALGSQSLAACPTLDVNGDDRVAINELLVGVNELLGQ